MKAKDFINKLKLLKIKVILKLKQVLQQKQLTSGENTEKWGMIDDVNKYLDAKKITLQLYKKDEENKKFILNLIQLLGEYGIEVELTEFEQIFNNEDMKEILEKNPNTKINLRYLIKSYYSGKNVETSYDIGDYCEVLGKVEYLSKVTRANFKEDDEQVMFVISQLSDYISFHKDYGLVTKEEEIKSISSLKGALLDRKTVCIGYAMACQLCLTDLGFDCNIVVGNANEEQPEILGFGQNNHAWNQVKLNDKWYNLDIAWASGMKNDVEEKRLKYILVDDETFESHYDTGTYVKFSCHSSYDRRKELYGKVRNIKNVLRCYDLGKRDTLLQYDLTNILTQEQIQVQKEITVNDKKEYEEEIK